MLKIKTLVVGELATNCFLVYSDKNKEALIVDPGDEADFIQRNISDLDLKPSSIVLTHGHFDHVLAAFELSLAYSIPIYLNKGDVFLVKVSDKTAKHFTKQKEALKPVSTLNVDGGDKINVDNEVIDVIATPGHTPGSIALYLKRQSAVFTGDLIFKYGAKGETNHSYSDPEKFEKSLKKILGLPGKTIVYPGHGEEFVVQSFQNV